jgi:hypothetical protein
LVRHGHLPERDIQTGIGAVPVKVPRVRDRAPEGVPLRFISTILPPYLETVRNFVPWRILLRHWEAFFEHDGELAFDGVPFAD